MSNDYMITMPLTEWIIKLLSEAYNAKFPDKPHTLTIEENNRLCRITCPLSVEECTAWIASTPYAPQNCFAWDGHFWQKMHTETYIDRPGAYIPNDETDYGDNPTQWQIGWKNDKIKVGHFPALKNTAENHTANALFERFAHYCWNIDHAFILEEENF